MSFKSKLTVFVVFAFILNDGVSCAMKKSWKSANFDADFPSFTPFNQSQDTRKIDNVETVKEVSSEISTKGPLLEIAEDFKTPYRSKVKSAANFKSSGIYDPNLNEFQKNSNDFGSFDVKYENNGQEVIDSGDESLSNKATTLEPEVSAENQEGSSSLDVGKILEGIAGGNRLDIEEIYTTIKDDTEDDTENNDGIEVTAKDHNVTLYNLGPLMNLTIDTNDNLVNVHLDKNSIKDIITGRGRGGKKFGNLERILPLFILPFLIQSAIIPFMVSLIKLFLIKSVFAGKIAIFLLLLGAFKNHQNQLVMKSMQSAPYFLKDYPGSQLPERRFEQLPLEGGYKAEGRPTTWIN